MPQAVWTGTVSFGLVSIPVKLYTATSPQDVRFRELDRSTGARVRHVRIPESPAAGAEVVTLPGPGVDPPAPEDPFVPTEVRHEDLLKGYEVEPGRYVTLTREELEALRPEPTRTIEIEEFVDLERIDPVYFERSYVLVPQPAVGGERPYALLLRAMEQASKVGIGRFVLRSKEYLAAIRPRGAGLGLETLFHDDEVRSLEEFRLPPPLADVDRRQLDMAVRLIDVMAAEWDPARHRDTYRQRVLDLIASKGEGQDVVVSSETPSTRTVGDLMAALQASVEAARAAAGAAKPKPRRRTG